ncbi:putative bifunctional diguanylate cyclase/phosphodiesterase [Microvirga lotononidis]|uniref:Diguanylate cyclase (GGDEF) domain-containing protein n=1 Tax=Microvirga lotononidis TaxID=864069 RepID=I4YZD6_9HYPH|nr:EAL domain-containing protein [Microvirga lotononidis]EIM29328.1 diguanylate cyclase (GGDEF) domain-containing protein [Microvirga lotononidis]WQO29153.1 EAL domain-containing protein [Microvirga lotononidis]
MSLRTFKTVIALVIGGFLIAAIYISVLVVQRQGALRQISVYNPAWEASQAASEFVRLEHRLSEFERPGSGVDKDEVALRYDILIGRVKMLNEGDFHALLRREPEHQANLQRLETALEAMEPLIQNLEQPGSVQKVIDSLKPFDGSLAQIASTVLIYGSEIVQQDQHELIRLHWVFSAIAASLILIGVVLILLLNRHNRLLGRAHEELHVLAHQDALTGLPNRVVLRSEVEQALTRLKPNGRTLAVSYLDLDHFKDVNDSFGHETGDELLKAVAERLRACIPASEGQVRNLISRFGGDEFAILQTGIRRPEECAALASRIVEALREPFSVNGQELFIGTSIGIALAQKNVTPSQILKHADMALYHAKADGRGTFRFFEPDMDEQLQARRALEVDLRKAMSNGEFELFYQPQINIQKNEIGGFEALLRWHHPERGFVPPAEFIPVIEDTGLISPLGDWIIEQACKEAATWPGEMHVAVNLSPIQFRNRGLVQSVSNALASSGLSPQRLELEITESVLLQDNEMTVSTLHQLRRLGVRIAMDDFGTGYSSLSYLRSFPFDKIKIDQSFVREMSQRADCLAIVQSVANLGSSLGMPTVAEGIETEDQLRQVQAAGCTDAQGYYFGRPKPARELVHTLAALRHKVQVA